jgi:ATP-dependent RNA helicase RhlE
MLFSATISGDVDRLARRAMQDHAAVEIGRRAEVAEGVEHVLVAVDKPAKRAALARMLDEMPEGRTLVFTRTKYGADKLAHHLRREGGRVAALHGGKTQSSRNKALDAFRQGSTRVLVATDVAARGIDVDDIVMVVNYDVPQDPEVYVHRVGRTARAGAQGIAVTLMSPDEWLMMRDVEKLMGRIFPRQVIAGFEPAVMPLQPQERAAPAKRQGPSVRPAPEHKGPVTESPGLSCIGAPGSGRADQRSRGPGATSHGSRPARNTTAGRSPSSVMRVPSTRIVVPSRRPTTGMSGLAAMNSSSRSLRVSPPWSGIAASV